MAGPRIGPDRVRRALRELMREGRLVRLGCSADGLIGAARQALDKPEVEWASRYYFYESTVSLD
jgi:hypothetical protein